ncbi:alpha/beta-hydrolase [Bimuria novae-zelandiae CBS 107.79]|uniref:Alpha/beta-hydrolase n=1 Tax=Bimuria novae-zelandiae CBS 107.79 TaxID=1447943 RepID=A0A6A5USB7_9PLEO|nr:alpha/beta-hydrolase [Bimuria novae-zelandiae CBS 107.79]
MIRPLYQARFCSLQLQLQLQLPQPRRAIYSPSCRRAISNAPSRNQDPRLSDIGRVLDDEYAVIREEYDKPKHTIILAHGLLGFDEIRLAGRFLPGIQYWRGITDALSQKGIEVIVASVPPSGSIEARAARLAEIIAQKAQGKAVNIIAGLDSRYMLSRLRPDNVKVLSLTTIATPHRGSAFADYMFDTIGPHSIQRLYKIMGYFGLETGAFSQLTRKYMQGEFNDKTPDVEGIKYYSYGASLEPSSWSVFALSHSIIREREGGPNDGLVRQVSYVNRDRWRYSDFSSVKSSQWGDYKGTLIGVSHLDLINWTNRLKWFFWELTGSKRNFNAIAFYLDIAGTFGPCHFFTMNHDGPSDKFPVMVSKHSVSCLVSYLR